MNDTKHKLPWGTWVFWLLLAVPSFGMMAGLTTGSATPHDLLHPTGEFAARFMIIAMLATPLKLLFGARSWTLWLLRARRHFGVAAFLYAVLHTAFYVVDMGSLQSMFGEFLELGIWTGWLAMFIFLPLGLTSNDYSVRKLGKAWKPMQRWVYLAAVATLVHWIFVENNLGPALVHFVPLALLEGYRLWHGYRQRDLRLQQS